MRIVGGIWRSRIIDAPKTGLRPTTDRVREAVFNILVNMVDFSECTACDLFAGTGAMGIEALSRGAMHVTFVEQDPVAAQTVNKNLDKLNITRNGKVVISDALPYASGAGTATDIVFADPPYDYKHVPELVEAVMTTPLAKRIFVLEHLATMPIGARVPWKRRVFGTTAISIFLCEDA
jgi:16S rRNA (guanine966-N2)-methyltransferase